MIIIFSNNSFFIKILFYFFKTQRLRIAVIIINIVTKVPTIVPIIANDTVLCSCSSSELKVVAPAVKRACVVRETAVVLLSAELVFGSVVEGVCDSVRVACSKANCQL